MSNKIPPVIGMPTESVRHLLQVINDLASCMDVDGGVHMREVLLETVKKLATLNGVDEELLLDKLLYV